MNNSIDIKELEKILNYDFKNRNILMDALTHLSYYEGVHDKIDATGERLEYLGDALLGFLIKEFLFAKFQDADEGALTFISSFLLSDKNFASWSKSIELNKFILLGKGEEKQNGRGKISILAHTFEALMAAVYLDGGIEEVKKILIEKFLTQDVLGSFDKWKNLF